MKASFYLRTMARESRGMRRRLLFFIACLAVGVAAVVSVAGLAASLDGAIRSEARQLLAADLAVSGWDAPPEENLDRILATVGETEKALVKELVTVVAAPPRSDPAAPDRAVPGPSRLVELKAVDGSYPFYGNLEVNPPRPLAELLTPETAVAAPELLTALGLAVGDVLKVGGESYRIAGVVTSEPDRLGGAFTLGPRLFLSIDGLARARLESRGSRVRHRILVKLPETLTLTRLAALAESLEEELGTPYRVETWVEAQPALRRGIRRAERFLGLVALLSLLAGGIGVAQTVRAYLAGRMDAIAVLKCLGLRPRQILVLYLGQTALLGLLGSLAGIALGLAIELAVPHFLDGLIAPGALDPWQPGPVLRGLGLGVGVALLFSLPPLLSVRQVPPARVLRRNAEPLPTGRWVGLGTGALLVGGIFALAAAQSGSLRLGAGFTGALAVAAALLAGAAWLTTRLAGSLAGRVGEGRVGEGRLALSQGLAALARPGSGTLGAIMALGLGVLVVLAMSLVQRHLSARFEADLPTAAPNLFLINIQPEQWQGVEGLLRKEGAENLDSVPVVTARLAVVDGKTVEELRDDKKGGSRRWALTREQQLTYLDRLPPDNEILEGALWSDPEHPEISVEEEFAEWLDLSIGSVLRFDIQGVPAELTVTSIRRVDWESFGINFYLVVEPGVLEEAPQQRIAAFRLPRGEEQRVQDLLAAGFPNVTLFNVREILEKVGGVIRKVGLGVRLLGGFTVLAGIAILAGAISATTARRGREVALLKTLGMTRFAVVRIFSIEYTLVGLAAGLIGTVGGGVLAWAVLTWGMEIPFDFEPGLYLAALGGSIALAVVAGLAASLRALGRRPVEVLRAEG